MFYTRKRKKNMSDLTTTADNISDLPESLLHLILSFLDMKQVVQTSCLSTKWRNIWRSVPVLNLNYYSLTKTSDVRNISCQEKFMDIVDHILFLRDDSGIQKLKLCSYQGFMGRYDSGRVDAWLLFVIKQQVKEIRLRINPIYEDYHQLPHLLFTSVIEVFEVYACSILSVQLPNSMCSATRLRILKLETVILPKGDPNGELVLTCPVLEKMFLNYCSHHDLKNLSICAPQLNNLVIYNCRAASCKIKICSPKLSSLKLISARYKDYFLGNLSSLVTVEIDVSQLFTKFFTTVLNGLCNVKTLNIFGYRRKTLPGFPKLGQGLNTFSNLSCLKFSGILHSVQHVTSLLKSYPYIKTLTFACYYLQGKEDDWGEELSIQYRFSHLEYVRVRNFNGHENHFKLLAFILRTAPSLQKITITAFSTKKISTTKAFFGSKKLGEFSEKLNSLPRASSSVTILFS